MERTLFLMCFKLMHEIRIFHVVIIVKFTSILCHENREKIIKYTIFFWCKTNQINAISGRETDIIFHVFQINA
jgi:hypothetical protein